MKILVTGASGFIGSNLIDQLLKQNYDISIITRKLNNIKKFNWPSKVKVYEKNLLSLSKEDYEICSRVNKQEKHYIGPLAQTEEKLIWYRKKLK